MNATILEPRRHLNIFCANQKIPDKNLKNSNEKYTNEIYVGQWYDIVLFIVLKLKRNALNCKPTNNSVYIILFRKPKIMRKKPSGFSITSVHSWDRLFRKKRPQLVMFIFHFGTDLVVLG